MKKKIIAVIAAAFSFLALASCGGPVDDMNRADYTVNAVYGNKQMFDITCNFNKVMIELPGGEVISGKLTSWMDYENSDQIQVVVNGTTYLTHISNVVMIRE